MSHKQHYVNLWMGRIRAWSLAGFSAQVFPGMGSADQAPSVPCQSRRTYCSLKRTGTTTQTATGVLPHVAGLNRHRRTASTAASLSARWPAD